VSSILSPATAALAAIVFVAFVVEAAVGFGATVITVTLAAQFLPLDATLASFIPLNLALSMVIVGRNLRFVDWRLLLGFVLPLAGVGLAGGLALFELRRTEALRLAFALFVVALSSVELARATRAAAAPAPPARAPLVVANVILGGFIHGLFGTGGPMLVWACGRMLGDKSRFRATLAVVWMVLNSALVVSYARLGTLGAESGSRSLFLLPSLAIALVVGERLHRRLEGRRFLLALWLLLLLAGVALAVRSLRALM
jgi:uncharacterized membrane protein YfcA